MYRILACLGLLLLIACQANAVPPLEFSSGQQRFGIKPYAEYLLDHSTDLTVDDLRQIARNQPERFQAFSGDGMALHLGYTDDVVWFKTRVHNTSEQPLELVFDVDYPHVNRVELYQFRGDQMIAHHVGGDALSLDNRHYRSRGIAFPVELPASAKDEFFFRVRTPGLVSLPVTVYTEPEFFQHLHLTSIVLYGIFGLYLGFFFYHMMVYVDNRERVYIAFGAATLTRLAYDLYASGEGQFFTPDAIYWNNLAFAYIGSIAAAAALWFHTEFLNLRQHSRAAHYAIVGYALAFLLGAQYGYFVDYYFFLVIGLLQLALPIVLCASALPWVIKGHRPAKIYLFGSALTLLSLFLSNISMLGLTPTVPNLAIYSALGYTLSFVVFSFSVSSRIKELSKLQQQAIYEAESARARDHAKSEFLAHMSHEIRTPLNGVLGMIQLLARSRLDAEQQSWVKIITSSGKNLLNIVNDILDYSKIEAGRLSLEQIPFDLRELCSELRSLFGQTESSRIAMALHVDPRLPQLVVGDPARLRQILVNLMGNAYKFTADGHIDLAVQKVAGSKDRYRISVSDTGIGINQVQQERLFSSFEQTRDDIHRRYGGTGLGLAICKQLTELMDGKIAVDSEPGRGSTFWLEIPLPEATELDRITSSVFASAQAQFPSSEFSLRILIAEDNRVNQIVVEKLLHKLGHHCTVVGDGCEAVEEVQRSHHRYDLILMDCDMPRKDGYEATAEIREFEQANSLTRLPIIALTAHAVDRLREKSLHAGMDDHLAKPLEIEALELALRKHCALEVVS